MDRRTTGMIATLVTVLICGFPGILGLCIGSMFAALSFIPGAEIDVFGNTDPRSALYFGIGAICIGALFILIPILLGYFTLRDRPASKIPNWNEPLPPAS